MMLQKSQKEALGIKKAQQVQQFVWNPKLGTVYESTDETNLSKGDEGQTYPEFLEMQKRPPNEEGTGRFKISHYDKIQIIFISQTTSITPSRQIKANICSFLSTYLRLKCFLNTKIQLEVDKHNYIVDKKTGLFFETKSQNGMIDAHDILSVLSEYQDEKTILLAFIEKDIHQQGYEIDGRAYGDGVATVCYNLQDMQERTLFYCQTALHETLHTLGFDHCLAWKCLMNSFTNFETWLCPACSRKLYHQLDLTSAVDIVKWIKAVLGVLAKLNARQSVQKGNKIIKNLS